MLNLSDTRVKFGEIRGNYSSFTRLSRKVSSRKRIIVMAIMLVTAICILILPWTQTIHGNGKLISLSPDQRPQTVHSTISGRIEKWYVQEGMFVKRGDTLLRLSEIKDEYFDKNLLARTDSQIVAKENSAKSYSSKANSLDQQISALKNAQELKILQAKNKLQQATLKIRSDSAQYVAYQTELIIAEQQFERVEKLFGQGLKSKTEFESGKLKLQDAVAKTTAAENKLLAARNEYLNAEMDIVSVEIEYNEKLSKASAEKFEALSGMFSTRGIVSKMQNEYENYSVRASNLFITAPQDGYITRAIRSGLGETLKEGEPVLSIMPANYVMAAEMYIDPIDISLVSIGQEVRLVFDGWPALFFSGWPGISTGTYSGKVKVIDNFISENGKFRILIEPSGEHYQWPEKLRIGTGVKGMALLKDVTMGYELWRQLNGFPPEYYHSPAESKTDDGKGK